MATAAPAFTPRRATRFSSIALFLVALPSLWAARRFRFDFFEPPPPSVRSNVNVTGLAGKTVTLREAIALGWLDAQRGKASSHGEREVYTPDSLMIYNKTGSTVRVEVPLGLKVDIPPSSSREVPLPVSYDVSRLNVGAASEQLKPDSIFVSVSLLLLAGGLFVILTKPYSTGDKCWAYATLGVIIGFWLRG
ncbi:MAG TPA: hypothetical protein VKW78_03980 [Terriglobales bacterium]|nr:hypothetical protein [Terriglobales bacterium]